jgi:hypothetical protein
VVHRFLVMAAVGCSLLVLASFGLFARDQLAGASKNQQTALAAGVSPSAVTMPARKVHRAAQPRRFIDGAARVLTSPFRSIVQSSSEWVLNGFPTILALLVYGFGLGYLARYSRGLS